MLTWSCVPCVAVLGAVVASDDATALLKKAQAATKAVQLVQYRGEYNITGFYARELPAVAGKVTLAKPSSLNLDRFFCDVKLRMPGADEWTDYPVGSDGEWFFRLDRESKLLREDIDPAVMGSLARHAQRILLREFAAAEPYRDDLLAKGISLREAQVVGQEECHVIHVSERPTLPFEIVWFVSKRDFLPRKVERVFKRETEDSVTSITVFDLEVEPKLVDDAFRPALPAGFTKTEEFAD